MTKLSLFSRRCVLGRSAEELRVVPARIDIEGPRIVAVHEGHSGERVDREDAVDFGERLVAPAFVNGHTHIALNSCRGLLDVTALQGNVVEDIFFRIESHLQPADVRAMARVGALECLVHGVGFVHEHYYFAEEVAAAMRDVGLAGVVAPTVQDLAGPGVDWRDAQLDAVGRLQEGPWAEFGIAGATGPHATDTVSSALMQRCVELSERLDVPLHMHVAQSAAEIERVHEREGVGPLAWLEREGWLDAPILQLLVHALFLDRHDLGRLRPERHVLGSNPYSQIQFGFPAPVEEWTEAGVPWSVGTDTVASNDSMQVQKELRLLAGQSVYGVTWSVPRSRMRFEATLDQVESVESLRRERAALCARVADPRFLLSRVWDVPGALHPTVQAGALEPGRLANLCVFDLDHPALWPSDDIFRGLAFADPLPAMTSMMVAGRWVGERDDPGALVRSDETREMIDEASRRRDELLVRAGIRPSPRASS